MSRIRLDRICLSRVCGLGFLLLVLPACRLPPDREPLKPLPEEGQVFSYDEILSRARAQSFAALEAFYTDNWAELAEAARGLEQSARFLPKTVEPPANIVGKLVNESVNLRKEALRLVDAANVKNVNAANETLQRINLKIRQLRPEPTPQQAEPHKDKKK
jgi:hypothetical protein